GRPLGPAPRRHSVRWPRRIRQALLHGHRDEYLQAVTSKLLTYALGRGLEYYDRPAVRAIVRKAARDNYRLSSLITAVVSSAPFQMRSTPENVSHQEIVATSHVSTQPRDRNSSSAARRDGARAHASQKHGG